MLIRRERGEFVYRSERSRVSFPEDLDRREIPHVFSAEREKHDRVRSSNALPIGVLDSDDKMYLRQSVIRIVIIFII